MAHEFASALEGLPTAHQAPDVRIWSPGDLTVFNQWIGVALAVGAVVFLLLLAGVGSGS